MELFDALRQRCSVRAYSMQVPGNRVQVDLLNYLNNVPVLLPEADIAIELLAFDDMVEYFPSLAYAMVHAPLYLAFRGELGLYQLMNVGYYAQHASVWLASKGLGSVWQTGFRFETLQEDELVYEDDTAATSIFSGDEPLLPAVLALGFPDKKVKLKPVKKRKLRRLLLNKNEELSNNLLTLLEAARMAPSEYNMQPWRFASAGEDMVHLFMQDSRLFRSAQRRQMRQAAIGCALGNMEIMAALKGIEMEYGFMMQIPEYAGASKQLHYMGTVRIEKVWRQMMFGFDPEKREAEASYPFF